jgi:Carboxypeptidase regulatory-like domain
MPSEPTRAAASVFLLAALLACEMTAQTTTSGALTGVIIDPSGAVVPDAQIQIKDLAKGTVQSVKSDTEGVYRFFFLLPTQYTLSVTHVGFQQENRIVTVQLGPPVFVNVTLKIAAVSNQMTVVDEVPLLQAENGDVSATMNQEQIREVPNPGNDLTYIVQTTPGVVMNTDQGGGNFSILGMPSTSYLYTIDGMNNPISGALGLLLGQNQIQEATVVSTGYSGQFGGAAGGNISYISKSGSNDFHGNAQYYWNGRAFNANNWFNNAFGVERPFDIANQWAGSIGGPIRKDKVFFFFDAEGLRLLIPQFLPAVIPSPQFEAATLANVAARFDSTSGSHTFYEKIFNVFNAASGASSATQGTFFPGDTGCQGFEILGAGVPCAMHFLTSRGRPSQDALTSGRVDWRLRRSDHAFLRLQYDDGYSAGDTDPVNPLFDGYLSQTSWQGQVIETHAFGSSAASQFLLSGSYIDSFRGAKDLSKTLALFPVNLYFFEAGPFSSLGNSSSFRNYQTQYQVSEDFIKTWRQQKFGFGVNLERTHWQIRESTANAVGALIPQTLDAFYEGGLDPNSPDTDFTQLSQSFPSSISAPVTFNHLGLYAQDEWQVRPGLMLTFAMRVEHQSNPVCENRCFARLAGPFNSVSHDPTQPYNQAILINQKQAFENRHWILLSPRFSFAWQPFGVSHNTVLRGGIGIFYDPVSEGIALNFSGNPPMVNSFTVIGDNLTPDETTSLFKNAAASNAAFLNAFTAGETVAQIKATVPNFFPPGMAAVEKQTHSPQYQRWSLQLQQAIGTNTSVSIGYFGHHGIHELVVNPNANAWGFGSLPSGRCTEPVPDCAPDPRFSGVTQYNTNAVSNYNGMVASFQHWFSGWSQGLFQANYTFGHAFDEVSNGGLFTFANANNKPVSLFPQDPNNLRGNYGPAEYDVRHSFNANYVWELPIKVALGGRGPRLLVNGWQVSGTIFIRSGLPYTVLDFLEPGNLTAKNYFGLLYAVPVSSRGAGASCGKGAAIPLAPHPCQPAEFFIQPDGTTMPNPSARFVQAGCETGFNAGRLGASGICDGAVVSFAQGRNRFREPGYFSTDFAIMKSTKIWENATLGIGFQFFNLFNHPNFGFPDTGLPSPGLGMIGSLQQPPTSVLGSGLGGDVAPRMIQLKAELKF